MTAPIFLPQILNGFLKLLLPSVLYTSTTHLTCVRGAVSALPQDGRGFGPAEIDREEVKGTHEIVKGILVMLCKQLFEAHNYKLNNYSIEH